MADEDGKRADRASLWTTDLELGIPLIDGQHKNLVQHLEMLIEMLERERPVAAVRDCLFFLHKYTEEHFFTEERYMGQHDFPGLADHAEEHEKFRRTVEKAVRFVQTDMGRKKAPQLVQSMLVNWYIQHIKGTDQAYAEFSRSLGLI